MQYSVIGTDGRARRTVDIEVAGSPMMHDFSLTERHVVFYDLPVTFDSRQAATMAVPRGLRLPARLLLSALIGRVRIPDPIAARRPDGTHRTEDSRTRGIRNTLRALASCHAREARAMCAGSMSSRATSSIR